MNRATVSLFAAILLALSTGFSWAQSEQPDASIDYRGGAAALAVGYDWGHGTLHYKGMDYPFTVNGLSMGDVGGSAVLLSGKAYHLTKIEDFPGNYLAFTAGATIGGGGAVVAMRNQNGVVLNISGTAAGLQFTLAPMGVAVTFDGPPTPSSSASR